MSNTSLNFTTSKPGSKPGSFTTPPEPLILTALETLVTTPLDSPPHSETAIHHPTPTYQAPSLNAHQHTSIAIIPLPNTVMFGQGYGYERVYFQHNYWMWIIFVAAFCCCCCPGIIYIFIAFAAAATAANQ